MSDLTTRLRSMEVYDAHEAADRIEHLERVLAQAKECLTSSAYFQEQSAPYVIAAIDKALKS